MSADPLAQRARLLDELAAAQPSSVIRGEIFYWLKTARLDSMSLHEAKSLLLSALELAQEPDPDWKAWMDQAARYGLAPRDAIRLAFRADALSRVIYQPQHEATTQKEG